MRAIRSALAGLMIVAAFIGPAAAENVLRWASAGGAATFDPHAYDAGPNFRQVWQVFETLVQPDFTTGKAFFPRLAVAWKPVNTTTMEVQVRQGVRFHDGTPLTVDDVVFSIHRAGSETSDLRGGLKNIVAVEAIDRQTVRIVTSKPGESVWYLLSFVSIMSRAWAEDNGVTVPENRLEGETSYATRHANGTGPFMLEAFKPGGQTVLVRNPNWWGLRDYPHNIDRIEHSVIAEAEARLAALRSGEIDFLFDPPLAGLQQIKDAEGLKITQAAELRTIWLGMDQGRAELRSSNVKGRNPFNDERVRRAMYHAIDSEVIRDNVMLGYSKPAGMLVPPGIEGYEPELDQRLPYDPETAEALLLGAGYPDGFSVTLDCPNNRLINDEAICRAVAAQLKAVTIDVTVNAQPFEIHLNKIDRKESDFWMDSLSPFPGGSPYVFAQFYHSQGPWNSTGYADPAVDELIGQAQAALVTYARDASIEGIWRLVLDDIVYLPLHHQMVTWAMRDQLDLPVDPWNLPRFHMARFK